MNEVYENKAITISLRNFYSKHRNLILIFIVILILFILSIFAINQVNKNNNNKAAEIYNKWTIQKQINKRRAKIVGYMSYSTLSF